MHGWENQTLRKEGLKELERLINHSDFSKSKKLLEVFYKYYSEGKEHEIQKMMDLFDSSESLADPEKTIGKRRDTLKNRLIIYYKTKEGRKAKYQIYFATNKLLGIKEVEGQKEKKVSASSAIKENTKASLLSQGFNLPHIKEAILDFFKIFPDVWKSFPSAKAVQWVMRVMRLSHRFELNQDTLTYFKQDDIINRVKHSSYPKLSAISALVFSLGIVVLLFWHFISQVEIVPTSPFVAVWQAILVNWLNGKVMNILMPGSIIIFIFILASSSVLQLIFKLLGGKAGFHETLNLNLYYFSAWIAFVVLGALLHRLPTTKINLALSWLLLFILI